VSRTFSVIREVSQKTNTSRKLVKLPYTQKNYLSFQFLERQNWVLKLSHIARKY